MTKKTKIISITRMSQMFLCGSGSFSSIIYNQVAHAFAKKRLGYSCDGNYFLLYSR